MKKLTAAQHKALYAPVQMAKGIATMAHEGQVYGAKIEGRKPEPYINHVASVVKIVNDLTLSDPDALAAAWLHDVLEDTKVTPPMLEQFGVAPQIIQHVLALTRKGNSEGRREPYEQYILRVKVAPVPRVVKIADLTANLRARPPAALTARYVKALFTLLDLQWLLMPSEADKEVEMARDAKWTGAIIAALNARGLKISPPEVPTPEAVTDALATVVNLNHVAKLATDETPPDSIPNPKE